MTGADILAAIKKHPIGSAAALLAVACLLALYFRADLTGEASKTLGEKSAEAEKIRTNILNATGLPQHLETLQAATKQLDSRLIRAGQLALNQQIFYRLESETGVKLVDVRQGALAGAKPGGATGPKTIYTTVPFTITIQGSFKQVTAFIERLEKGTHFVRFSSVNFTKLGAQQGSDTGVDTLAVSLGVDILGTP